eukprot:TRINITY_DN10541_c0_g1_i1.p1 TRINITY_DN10541_c0_g1~~TRINITY_DN10541_c0_g1_i1.p1  ORF type:complete len:150 (+),score=8.57 TRINITY_DN10541_c0_g1_i1:275-724(+)
MRTAGRLSKRLSAFHELKLPALPCPSPWLSIPQGDKGRGRGRAKMRQPLRFASETDLPCQHHVAQAAAAVAGSMNEGIKRASARSALSPFDRPHVSCAIDSSSAVAALNGVVLREVCFECANCAPDTVCTVALTVRRLHHVCPLGASSR